MGQSGLPGRRRWRWCCFKGRHSTTPYRGQLCAPRLATVVKVSDAALRLARLSGELGDGILSALRGRGEGGRRWRRGGGWGRWQGVGRDRESTRGGMATVLRNHDPQLFPSVDNYS